MNPQEALRAAMELSDAWDFSEVDDGLDTDIIAALAEAGYTIVRSDDLAALRAAAERVEPLLKARHGSAHKGGIVSWDLEDCPICGPVLAELAALEAPYDECLKECE